MLPHDARNPAVQAATQRLADAAARRVVVLVGGGDWPAAERAADAYAGTLQRQASNVALRYRIDDATADGWLNFFGRYRAQLLTAADRKQLSERPASELANRAVEMLYRPVGLPRLSAWRDDPLNLFTDWLGERLGASRVRVTQGRLSVNDGDRHYAVLTLEQPGSAFSMTAQQALLPVLDQAKAAAQQASPGVAVITSGVPLFAAAAASQAEREMHTIGVGSLAGIVVLTLFAFSAIRPRLLVTLSIAIGLLAATSVCALVFGKLHMITLVFGASLVGVAENYGTNYFSNRLGRPLAERWAMLREQAPVMWLAMLTTAIGYALLALAPFPGLQQMAVFSAVGLLSAFVTVLWWFPFLDGAEMETTRLSRWLGSRRRFWPTLGRNRFTVWAVLTVVGLLIAGGLALRANDDIRLLQHAPADLLQQQMQVSRLLDTPSPAQFYLVQGATPEQVLMREEALKARLDVLRAQGGLAGYQAVSDWVPSLARQRENATLSYRVIGGEQGVLAQAMHRLGEDFSPAAEAPFVPLRLDDWLASPVSETARFQWLGRLGGGYASVVMLRGIDQPSKLSHLAALAAQLDGVRWVDKVGEVSDVLARYRVLMGWVILVSYALVFAALTKRFGQRAWRALTPTALASLLALAFLGLLGQPLQLFNILALLLILGMGADYGIFMLENPGKAETRPFLSVSLAAASTLLAFGLLALSTTPALRAFGLTMLFGIALAWLMTPAFMPVPPGDEL